MPTKIVDDLLTLQVFHDNQTTIRKAHANKLQSMCIALMRPIDKYMPNSSIRTSLACLTFLEVSMQIPTLGNILNTNRLRTGPLLFLDYRLLYPSSLSSHLVANFITTYFRTTSTAFSPDQHALSTRGESSFIHAFDG